MNNKRRQLMQGGVAAGSLFLPLPYAYVWAQSEGATRLLRLPKTALVIGNSKYQHAPLKNPANDARAIAAQLKQSGFEVTLQMDVAREPMTRAIEAYAALLAKTKAVGLFYFAGHGVQLAWRNFLLPVDADIDKIEDIPKQCVDVGTLVSGITKAANPMNVVILDACRDNPFGSDKRLEQKGLSQLDAPHGTLLAYATSPGNVASDGEGANGLYTENLLRELKVPEAKIEDVFKRVRLGVRRRSNGQQIPWESTSLEEDFYFLPPRELIKLSERELERLFEEELALWEKARQSPTPPPIEEYLRRYPSGRFSEVAQLHLDRVLARQGEKKIRIQSSAENPFTKGTGLANTDFKVGDTYNYRIIDLFTKMETTRVERIAQVVDEELVLGNGSVLDLLGNPLRLKTGMTASSQQTYVTEYAVGKRWLSRAQVTQPSGAAFTLEMEYKVTTREKITVPAGTFDAYRVEGKGWIHGTNVTGKPISGQNTERYWMAPDLVRRPVASETFRQVMKNVVMNARMELIAFKQG